MKTVTLKVDGMRCDGCAATLQALLQTEEGVRNVTVSHEEGEARVLFDPEKINIGQLISIAKRPGFEVAEKTGT